MKHRIFVVLLSSILLVLPGFAQQTSSNSSAQPAATPDQTAAAPQSGDVVFAPLQEPTSGDFWDGDEPNLANLLAHPLTTKKYVERHVGPIRDRLNELEQVTTANSRMIKDVDGRAQQGIQLVSEKTNLADQHATDATSKAQTAQASATQATTHISSVEQAVGNLDQYKANAQTEIRFRPGQSALSKQAKDALDEMAAPLKDQRSYIIEIRSFAPGHGQAAIANSHMMADSVVRYLILNHNVPVYRIFVESMGNAPVIAQEGTAAKHTSGGHVEVSLLKNDLAASAQH